jgi:hypothetical protein
MKKKILSYFILFQFMHDNVYYFIITFVGV